MSYNKEEVSNINFEKWEFVGLVKQSGEFETEDGNSIPWANYRLRVKMPNGIVIGCKIDKLFTDTIDELIVNEGF